jgi:hypothetical protein
VLELSCLQRALQRGCRTVATGDARPKAKPAKRKASDMAGEQIDKLVI